MNSSDSARPATSNYRWMICALLFWVTTANYIDRGVFGNLAPDLQKEIGWTQRDYWNMTVAFNAAYAVSLVLAGRMMDLIGLRWGFVLACGFWGLASMSHSLVSTVTGFFIVRILLGLGEGGNFPAAIKTTAEWFPKRERALATGIFNSGSNIGGVLVPFGLPFVVAQFATVFVGGRALGWRGAFLVTGLFDMAWIIAWLLVYKKPQDHPRVSREELALINSEPPETTVKIPWRRLIPHRQCLAFAVAKFMTDPFWWFYLVGTPYFFSDRFGLSLKSRGGPIAAIYLFASVGSIGGGWLSGHFMKRGWTTNKSRKVTLLICSLFVLPVVVATMIPVHFSVDGDFFAKAKTAAYLAEQSVTVDGVQKMEKVKAPLPEDVQTKLRALSGQSFSSALDFSTAAAKVIGKEQAASMSGVLVECARSNNFYWFAVVLIAFAAAAHQAWSANVFSLAGDMFPRRVVGSVTGLGGFAGSIGAIILFFIVGKIRDASIARGEPGNYFVIFLAASVAYIIAVGLIHLLVPKLEPAKV